MKISTNWLQDILNLKNINLLDLKERLTLTGFEIEETVVSKRLDKNDIILDLKPTTNRPDSISIAGLSYEISCLLNRQLKKSKIKKTDFNFFNCYIEEKTYIRQDKYFEGTIIYIAAKIENINLSKIQPWILKRLFSVNIEPKNTLYDLSSYLMLEWGQPFFLYDYDKIKKLTQNDNPQLNVRFAKSNEIFIDSSLKEYYLNTDNLLVIADNIPIALAGSLISKDVCIDLNTKNLLVEASIFEQKLFRKSERSLGIRNEFSLQYERGINPFLVKPAFNRFLNLLLLFNKSESSLLTFYNIYTKNYNTSIRKINLQYENTVRILGVNTQNEIISKFKIFDSLNLIKFRFIKKESFCEVLIPFTRLFDIEEQIDLIEEIARIIGFNKFLSIIPNIYKIPNKSNYQINKKKFRRTFLTLGFIELFNYSLTFNDTKNNIKVLNPLNNDYSSLRTSLLPQLLQCIEKNLNKGNYFLPVFEIGRVFKYSDNKNFFETDYLSGIWGISKYRTSWSDKNIDVNWFQAKGFMQTIFLNLQLPFMWSQEIPNSNFFHPKNCLSINIGNENVGIFGKIHPKIAGVKNISKNCFLFELKLTKIIKLLKNQQNLLVYQEYSLYPTLIIDLSLFIPIKTNFYIIETTIKKIAGNILEKVELFDFYEKVESSKDFYSLSVKLCFRSLNKTLIKTEIDPILLKIENELNMKLNVRIRN